MFCQIFQKHKTNTNTNTNILLLKYKYKSITQETASDIANTLNKMSQSTYEFTQEGFQALVARVFELETKLANQQSARTVSPPPGMSNDRTRSYSNQSSGSCDLSSLEEFAGNSSKFTQMPCKPKYGEIVCSALLDGWLIHGNTYKFKDMIKGNGAKWFGKCKGWALNDKSAVANILKQINIKKHLEQVKNTFENLGLRFYTPNDKKEAPQPLSDEEAQKENATLDTFLSANQNTCIIDESEDEENFSEDKIDISDLENDLNEE
jgi:hypothetical protein